MIANGHTLDDIKNTYTTQQVWKFYEMCKKKEYNHYQTIANIMYMSVQCGSLADSKKASDEQKRHWKKFITNFDWDQLMRKSSRKQDPLAAFRSIGMAPGGIIQSRKG